MISITISCPPAKYTRFNEEQTNTYIAKYYVKIEFSRLFSKCFDISNLEVGKHIQQVAQHIAFMFHQTYFMFLV